MKLIEELQWRGLIHDMIPGTDEILEKQKVKAYIGFDPTAASLTIGNLVPVMLLLHLQNRGHQPIALIGGATGMIGDPSGKSNERNFLDEETLLFNQDKFKLQLKKFIDFESSTPSKAILTNNYDWYKGMTVIDFLRNAGKHLTVNYMTAKESVKNRLETGISFTEFSYQLMQAWDFYQLYSKHDCIMQAGGADQWGNITSGVEMIRKKTGKQVYAFTAPLLTRADGSKFGKSEGENIWLDPDMTSPYKFYQFWINSSDEEAEKLIKIFTLLDRKAIEHLIEEHHKAPHTRLLQKELAKDITVRVHGHAEFQKAINASEALFGKSEIIDENSLDEATFLSALEGIPNFKIDNQLISNKSGIDNIIGSETAVFKSKAEYKQMLRSGALRINKQAIQDSGHQIKAGDLLFGKYLLIQKGKKNYFLGIVEESRNVEL